MKKLLLSLLIAVFAFSVNAQDAKKEKKGTKATATTEAPAKLKKDGSPDMRYKENKEAAKAKETPAGPTKKDGTPDKRFKANKGK